LEHTFNVVGHAMRFIPTLFHGIADYVVGLLVLALPYLLALSGSTRIFFIVMGVAVLIYSLMTDYELGVVRFLRIRFHLLLDALFGVAMLLAPWAFTIPDQARWPVYIIGVLAIALALTTEIRAIGTADVANN
jgi:hypothetical protein